MSTLKKEKIMSETVESFSTDPMDEVQSCEPATYGSSEVPVVPQHKVLDSSKLTCFATCARKYFYEYVLGWSSDYPKNDLVFGEAWHAALAFLYENRSFDDQAIMAAFDEFTKIYRASFPSTTDELFHPKTPVQALRGLVAYCNEYQKDASLYEVIATEIGGRVSIHKNRLLAFRMDTLLRNRENGKILSLEHKTRKGSLNRIWEQDFLQSVQVGTYSHVLYCYAQQEEVFGVIINGTAWSKAKNPKITFNRLALPRSKRQLGDWLWTVNYWYERIEDEMHFLGQNSPADQTLRAFPKNWTACSKYYGCQWLDFCLAWSNPLRQAAAPPAGYSISHWNPLDKPVKKEINV